MDNGYASCAAATGFLVFVVAWIYAIAEYGFFLGVGLGWIPAGVIGAVAGLAWPLIVLAVGALVWLALAT